VLHRILRLAGLPTDMDSDNIDFLMLRKFKRGDGSVARSTV